MLRSLALALAPVLIALTFAFALFHGYRALLAARVGNWPIALMTLVLALGGLALSVALLGAYRRIRAQLRQPPEQPNG